MEIRNSRDAKKPLILILPVGPMGMYKWAVYFLKEWGVKCNHVHGFNMDEWSDANGNTLPAKDPGAFQNAMEEAFYGPLGKLTVPAKQRHFATKKDLPKYGKQIAALRKRGGGKYKHRENGQLIHRDSPSRAVYRHQNPGAVRRLKAFVGMAYHWPA